MAAFTSLIPVAELSRHLNAANWRVVDCRFDLTNAAKGRSDYQQAHIPGAVYAHLDDDLAAPVTPDSGRHPLPPVADFVATLERLGISSQTQVIAYDAAGGGIAARLWWMLRWLGHDAVAVLDGGFAAWREAGLPVDAASVSPPAGSFEPRPRREWVLATHELADAVAAGRPPALIDAREPARFNGEQEPIDSVAGRIPGAKNFPFAQNLQPSGLWRGATELQTAWQALFAGQSPTAGWTVMCGSGVTACHLALSAERAGLPPPRLYAGSWSEWIRDPARPRAGGRWQSGSGPQGG